MSRFAPFDTWIPVESSNVAEVMYEPAKDRLSIRFKDAKRGFRTYLYGGVPPQVFLGLLEAPSKGQYVHKHIRDRYAYMEI